MTRTELKELARHGFYRALNGRPQYALAEALGVTPAAVSSWDGVVPAERVRAVSRILKASPADLRPDLYAGMVEVAQMPQAEGATA